MMLGAPETGRRTSKRVEEVLGGRHVRAAGACSGERTGLKLWAWLRVTCTDVP